MRLSQDCGLRSGEWCSVSGFGCGCLLSWCDCLGDVHDGSVPEKVGGFNEKCFKVSRRFEVLLIFLFKKIYMDLFIYGM